MKRISTYLSLFLLCISFWYVHYVNTSCQKPNQQSTAIPIVPITSTIESTFGMIKPDAVQNKTSGDIIKVIEQNGFRIKNMRKYTFSKKEAETFYAEHKGKPFFDDLIAYITSGPIIGLELEKENAIADWRTLIGATDPHQAQVGTLRKMFAASKSQNAVHGSDSKHAAQRELHLFFS